MKMEDIEEDDEPLMAENVGVKRSTFVIFVFVKDIF